MKMFLAASMLLFISHGLLAFQEGVVVETPRDSSMVQHGPKGFEWTTADKNFQLQITGRLQFRFATPYEENPLSYIDLSDPDKNVFKINRARLKIGGYTYHPWLKYYFEYDMAGARLLDFRIMLEKWPGFNIKIGQWKTEYSRERSISSGKQQMMERSIINRPFTVDRQQGISFYGHLDGGGLANFNYNLSVLTGNGRGASTNDDKNLMYTGKLQWNFLGEGVEMSGSDLSYQEKPTASLALAGATNTSQFTRFSSQGGGNLVGYEEGAPGQFTADQWLMESAFQYRSFSFHGEYHRKKITDNFEGLESRLMGWFTQGGYILNNHDVNNGSPLIEIAGRYAHFRPNRDLPMNIEKEYTMAVNCFFNAHGNKLTVDATRFGFETQSMSRETSGWRFRVQYDISF